MKTNEMKNRAADEPCIRPVAGAVESVESEDLSRFEGEGGPEAPTPDLVDVPLRNAIWRRPRWAAHQTNQKEMTI
ncbi:MAG TPA: hypothetical protein VFY06_07385 [Verrucomicrobiae bacterium]|nr:hypothetical protein [Verrucomicrobiae bacterium]